MGAARATGRRGRQSIGAAAVILLGGFVASRFLGLARDVLIGARFGTTPDYDLYVAAFKIPDAIFTLVAGGALGSALVPVFSEYLAGAGGTAGAKDAADESVSQEAVGAARALEARQGEAEDESARHIAVGTPERLVRLAAAVFNLLMIVGGVAAVLGIVFARQVVPLFGGFNPEQQDRLALLVRVLLLQPVFFGMAEVVTRFLNVHQHFTYPALAPAIYNLAIIAGTVLLGPSLGTLGPAIGVTAGALLYFLIQVPEALRFGFRWQPALELGDPGLRQIALLMVPRMVGQGAVQLSNILTTRVASYLPAGRLSALNYGFLIMMLPLGTFATSLATAAFPTLANQAAEGALPELARTSRRTLSTILFMMLPAAVGLAVLGLPLIQTVFQRRAFTPESSALTYTALALYAVGLPAHGAIEILARTFYALKDTRTPVVVGVAAMVANIALAYTLVGPLGHGGIALALSVTTVVEAVALFLVLRARLPSLARDLGSSTAKTVVASTALGVVAVALLNVTRSAELPPVVQAVVAGGGATAAFVAVAYALRSEDLVAVLGQVRRRIGR